MSMFSDEEETLKGGNAGGGKTQRIREQVRNAAPRHVWLVNGAWEPASLRVFQLASATTIDVKYIREDLVLQVRKSAVEKAASEIFDYVHQTDGGYKSDFIQGHVIEIISKYLGEMK